MQTRRSILRGLATAPLGAAAAVSTVPAKRPARVIHAFRISTVEFQRAHRRKPRPMEERYWRFRLVDTEGEIVSLYSGEINLRGPYVYALGLCKWWAWQNGTAVIEVLD
jgi:hypothetical protein